MNKYKQLRLKSNLIVVKASKELNISASYLWSIENGTRNPGRDLLIRMSRVYNCKLEDIFLENNYTECIGM